MDGLSLASENMDKMEVTMRVFFLFVGLLLWAGIWLTDIEIVHWLLYLPATFLLFSALTGICPGMVFFKELFREKQPDKSD